MTQYDPVAARTRCIAIDRYASAARGVQTAWARAAMLVATSEQVAAAAQLVVLHYQHPDLTDRFPFACRGEARDLDTRVAILRNISEWGAIKSFGQAAVVPLVGPAVMAVLNNAAGSQLGNREAEVVYAAAHVVYQSRDASLDAMAWIPLWQWAVGGPVGAAPVRTRVMAMQAIQAIIRRQRLLPAQLRAADSLAAVLRGLVLARAPSINPAERDLYLSEADATVGAVAAALAKAELDAAQSRLPPGAPLPDGTWPTQPVKTSAWLIPAIVASFGVFTIGAVAVILTHKISPPES